MRHFGNAAPLALLALVAVGCAGGPEEYDDVGVAKVKPYKAQDLKLATNAGLPVPAGSPGMLNQIVKSRAFNTRPDPFALHSIEAAYDTKQLNLRMVADGGNFSPLFTYVEPTPVAPVMEPQPPRRLAGVLIGDSILAIIEMGPGQPAQIIRPGMRIPGTDWTVVSIDEDKAVLRREGNKLPHEIVVRLETRPFDSTVGSGVANGNAGGAPAGGAAPSGGTGGDEGG